MKIATLVTILVNLTGLIGFLAVAPHIGTTILGTFVILYVLSVYCERTEHHFFPRWLLNLVSLAVLGLTVTRLNIADPVVPIIEALLIMLAIKFLERKQFRDHMQIFLIAVFLLAGSALVSLGLAFLIYLLALAVLIPTALVFLAYLSQDPSMTLPRPVIASIASKATWITALSLPLAALLFVILPRTNYPFLSFLSGGGTSTTGFTDQVSLGGISEIQEDTGVIFRSQMERVPNDALYWRGIVLDHFDGTRWRDLGRTTYVGPPVKAPTTMITQTIYLDPYGNRFLFALDKPLTVTGPRNIRSFADLTFRLSSPLTKRVRYEALSAPSPLLTDRTIDPSRYLQLPADLSLAVKGLAKQLARPGNAHQTITEVLAFLRDGEFGYSLQDLPRSSMPLDDFLFKIRRGNCEYFASAMAVLLRAAGIPSRLVGGYRGGFYSDVGSYYVVLQKNAHVWVETYLPGEGWLRVDPTPVAAEQFTTLSDKAFSMRLRLALDVLTYYWNAIVLPYDFDHQAVLFRQLQASISRPLSIPSLRWNWSSARSVILGILVLFAIVGVVIFIAKRPTTERVLLRDFLARVRRSGYVKRPSEGLEEFVNRITDTAFRERAASFVKAFESAYYRDRKLTNQDVTKLRLLLRDLDIQKWN